MNGKESYTVQVSPSELIPVLWMVIVFVAAASIVSVSLGFYRRIDYPRSLKFQREASGSHSVSWAQSD